jgi:hypothetical protein
MDEILKAVLAALESQEAKIKKLEALLETQGGSLGNVSGCLSGVQDAMRFDAFSEKYGGKFKPVVEGVGLFTDGFDPVRAAYEKAQKLSGGKEAFNEDEFVDETIAEAVERLEKIKALVSPEAVPAVEAAEEALQEAAAANDQAEAAEGEITDPGNEQEDPDDGRAEWPGEELSIVDEQEALDDYPEEWSEEMLEKEKQEGRKLYA